MTIKQSLTLKAYGKFMGASLFKLTINTAIFLSMFISYTSLSQEESRQKDIENNVNDPATSAQIAKQLCRSRETHYVGLPQIAHPALITEWIGKLNDEVAKRSCLDLAFSTAPNFSILIKNATQLEYDFLVAPPHFSSYLMKYYEYTPVAQLVWKSKYVYLVSSESDISTITQLDKEIIALPDPLAETSILVQNELSGISNDVSYTHFKNYSKVFEAVVKRDASVGVLLLPIYEKLKTKIPNKTQIIHTRDFPSHGLLLASPTVAKIKIAELFGILKRFEEGNGLFWQEFLPVTKNEERELHNKQQESVEALEQLLSQGQYVI